MKKYRIIEEGNGMEKGIYIQRKYSFLFISYWKYIVDENSLMGGFYRYPMKFLSKKDAEQYITLLNVPYKREIL